MSTIALFGDIGGHFKPFKDALCRLGIEFDDESDALAPTWWPPDLIVIQVGDLVHRGPHSDLCVMLAGTLLHQLPDRYIQLAGNHEGHHLGGPQFGHPNDPSYELEPHTESTLKALWWERKIKMAQAIEAEDLGDVLVTHAGLVPELWKKLGSKSARSTALSLNSMGSQAAFRPGLMLGGDRPGQRPIPGVAWAWCSMELYPMWRGREAPFHQVHGHSTPYWWNAKQWSQGPPGMESYVTLDKARRFSTADIGGKRFFCIDQSLGRDPWFDVEPLVLQGTLKE